MAGIKGRSGRPRKSKELHIAQGTYREDRHGGGDDAAEVIPIPRMEWVAPSFLTVEARKEWERLTPAMIDTGRLTELDRPAWTMLWIEYGRMLMVDSANGSGFIQQSGGDEFGDNVQSFINAEYTIHKDARTAVLSLMTQFGLTPRSRAGLYTPLEPTKSEPKSKMGQFLKEFG